jgi:hypothetical protein
LTSRQKYTIKYAFMLNLRASGAAASPEVIGDFVRVESAFISHSAPASSQVPRKGGFAPAQGVVNHESLE